jgi:23S rRNA pseudouridine1911/1915/1917 synthase
LNDNFYKFTFSGEKGFRLDKFLTDQVHEISRSQIQNLIGQGFISVNNIVTKKNGFALEPFDEIQLFIPPVHPVDLIPENIPLDIVFENRDLIVINKPAGMVVHPAAGHFSGTLIHAVLAHSPDIEGIGGELRPGIVHRLDKQTSGLILVAKNDRTHRFLQEQFRSRAVTKKYLALVDSHPPTPSGRIEASIGRDPANRKRMAVVQENKGRLAITEYFTKERFAHHTYLEVHPITGRTHQIRLHLAYLKCPVTGDMLYGYKKPSLEIDRHFLHASSIVICIPGKTEPVRFDAPLPEELEFWLKKLT